jgi:hypothetical protein
MGITDTDVKISVSDPLEFVCQKSENNYQTFAYSIFNENELQFKYPSGNKLLDDCISRENITLNIIAPIEDNEKIGFVIDSQEKTNGIHIENYSDFSGDILTQIFDDYTDNSKKTYILSSNLQPVVLDKPIDASYKTAFDVLRNNPDLINNYSSYADTDKDELYDFQEIDFSDERISRGDITLSANRIAFRSYEDYCSSLNLMKDKDILIKYDNILIIPSITNPSSSDTDNDFLNDRIDLKPLSADWFSEFNEPDYYISQNNLTHLTYTGYYELYQSAFAPYQYLEIDEQKFSIHKFGNHYRIYSNAAGNKPLEAVKTVSGYVLRVSDNDLNNTYQQWNIYNNADGTYTIINYGIILNDNKFVSLSPNAMKLSDHAKLNIDVEFGIEPPKVDSDGKIITIRNFYEKDSKGSCLAEEYFNDYIWDKYLFKYPFIDDSDKLGCFTAWGESEYGDITDVDATTLVNIGNWVRSRGYYTYVEQTYVTLGLVDAGVSIVDGVFTVIVDPIGTVSSTAKLVYDKEQQELLWELIAQTVEEYQTTFTNDELYYNGIRLYSKAVAELTVEIITAKITIKAAVEVVKNTKIVGKMITRFKDTATFAKIIKISTKFSAAKLAIIEEVLTKAPAIGMGIEKIHKFAKKLEFLNDDIADLIHNIIKKDPVGGVSTAFSITDLVELYGKNQADIVLEYGDTYIRAVEKYGDSYAKFFDDIYEATKARNFDLLTDQSFTDNFRKYTMRYDYTTKTMQPIPINEIDSCLLDELIKLREYIGTPPAGTTMQKVISLSEVDDFIKYGWTPQRSVSVANDTYGLYGDDLFESLRLDYYTNNPLTGLPEFKFKPGDGYATITFTPLKADDISIPTNMYDMGDSWTRLPDTDTLPPFAGTGFTASPNGNLIPEYYFANGAKIEKGALLTTYTNSGEVLEIYEWVGSSWEVFK